MRHERSCRSLSTSGSRIWWCSSQFLLSSSRWWSSTGCHGRTSVVSPATRSFYRLPTIPGPTAVSACLRASGRSAQNQFVSESNCSGSLRNYASKKSAIRSWTSETTLIPSSRNKLNGLIAPGRNELAAGPVTFVAQRRKRSMSESDLTSLVAFQHSRNRENPGSKVQSQTKDTIIITNQASTSLETAKNVIRSGQTRGMSCSTEQDRQHNRQEPPMTPGTPNPAGQTASPRGQTASPRTKSYERMIGNQQACPMTPARGSPARGPCDNPIIILRTDAL